MIIPNTGVWRKGEREGEEGERKAGREKEREDGERSRERENRTVTNLQVHITQETYRNHFYYTTIYIRYSNKLYTIQQYSHF